MKNDDGWIGKKGYRYWYYRYRDSQYYAFSIISVTIVVCLVLLFNVILPEMSNWFSIRKEVIATQEKIATLQNNISFINNLDKGTLNKQLDIAASALPPQKDFGPMLNAISSAALTSGVALNDYTFEVGSVASSKGQLTDVRYKGIAVIKITLIISGSLNNVSRFITSIEKSVPIAEVTNIDGSGENVSVSVQFYQKPFPKVDVSGDQQLQPISAEKLGLLQQLQTWKQASAINNTVATPASNAAVPLF
ncbi:MAG: hypothetical protein ACREHC_06940 [Candidatus Levyibacteriota bacterium]